MVAYVGRNQNLKDLKDHDVSDLGDAHGVHPLEVDLRHMRVFHLQGYLAHKKQPLPLGPPKGHLHSPAVGF